jgi:hypothetical protein
MKVIKRLAAKWSLDRSTARRFTQPQRETHPFNHSKIAATMRRDDERSSLPTTDSFAAADSLLGTTEEIVQSSGAA